MGIGTAEMSHQPNSLVGLSLADFRVVEMIEVYRPSGNGASHASFGFFTDEDLAKEYAKNQKSGPLSETRKELVLTNGKEGYLIGKSVIICNEHGALAKMRQHLIESLTPFQRRLLQTKPDGTPDGSDLSDDIPF